MHLRTKFEFNNLKFAEVWQCRENFQQISNFKKFERLDRLWQKFVCSFRTIAKILRNLLKPRRTFFREFKFHTISDWASISMKIVTSKGPWLLHRCTKCHFDISRRLWVIEVRKVENRTHTHTRMHTRTHGHTYFRTPAKNHISRRLRLFWVPWH